MRRPSPTSQDIRDFRYGYVMLMVIISSSGLLAQESAKIRWRDEFEPARAEAKAQNKPLWVQFTGTWCLFCKRMDRETLSSAGVLARARDFVTVKVQADDRADLVERFGVEGLPATILLAPDGRVIARSEGFSAPEEFLGLLESAGGSRLRKTPEIALAGYDPVSLVQGEGLTPGRSELAAEYDGRLYRFAAQEDRDLFLKSPERFSPCGEGRCLVSLVERGKSVAGDPRFGVYYRGHLYLCATDEARQMFARNPERYATADLADDGHCPHCRGILGRLVSGLPQFSLFYHGRRYLFPDEQHRAAFRAEPEKFLR